MVRKQYYLSRAQVERIEELREIIGASSDAEVIRRAIDHFDPDAIGGEDRQKVEQTAAALCDQIDELKTRIDDTLARTAQTRDELNDSAWIEAVRARARTEAKHDPALIAGVAALLRGET